MATNPNIKFLRGLQSQLPSVGVDGVFYLTTDTHRLYVGQGESIVPVNEGVTTVANINALTSITGATAGDFFYATEENILAVYNGKTFVQINPDTGMTSVEVVGEGNAVTDASYDPTTRKLTLTKGETFATNEYIGTIPETATATNVIAYIQEKTAGIATDTALEELTGRVKAAEDGIGALQEASAKHVEKEEGKSLILDTEITRLAGMSDGANKVETSENGKIKIDGVDTVVYTHPDKHAVDEVDGLQDALDGKQDVIPENTYDAYGAGDQALTDAKAYVDAEDIFEVDMLTVNAHGGVAANEDLNGLTTHEILKKILYPYVQPTVGNATATPNGGTYEKGVTKTITQVSISVTKKSEAITSVALYNGSTLIEEKTGDDVKNGGTITFSGLSVEVPTDGNQLTVKVTDAKGTVQEKKTTSMNFVYPYYMGTCAAGTAIDETLIESLTKKVEGKGNKSNSFTVSDGHMVFAYPKANGVLKSILDPNNFETIGNYTLSEVSVTGLDGTAQTYYVYVSGATTVSGFVVNFKY